MEEKTYYDILGVSFECTIDEIKIAYRKLIKKLHPDKNSPSEEIKKINKAYSILKDSQKRHNYDSSLNISKKSKIDTFQEMKNSFCKFKEQIEKSDNKEYVEQAKKIFQLKMKEENEKLYLNDKNRMTKEEYNYRLNEIEQIENEKPQVVELDKRIKKLELIREQDDIEDKPKEEEFNIIKFNAVFDEIAKETNALIKYNPKILASNDIDECINVDYITDVNGNDPFKLMNQSKKEIPKKNLEDLVKDRQKETEELKHCKYEPFETTQDNDKTE
jgi:curved DNA-binding protein CbpA